MKIHDEITAKLPVLDADWADRISRRVAGTLKGWSEALLALAGPLAVVVIIAAMITAIGE